MSYICKNCYRMSKVKMVSCPKCGAAESFVLTDELAPPRSALGPAGPVGADTGGIMPKVVDAELLPPLPLFGSETKKESEKKRSKKKLMR